jgi:regulator of sirC expression with transglutaminase-like and TPR domain
LGFEYQDNYNIKDWKKNVVEKLNEEENIKEISEYALHIARIINYPKLSIDRYIKQIEEMGEELKRKIKTPKEMRPTQIIEKFNDFFFIEKKFQSNTNDYYNPNNNYLNIVLEKKTGIPITLSIIYIHLASFLDFELQPVNFPSHFLVKYTLDKVAKEFIIIDPFNLGRIMDDYTLKDLLNKMNPRLRLSISNSILETASTSQILIRLLNNLKIGYTEIDNLQKIELINEMILSLDRINPDAIKDKGMILYRYKKLKESLEYFYQYVEVNPEAEDIDKILELIRQIRNTM